MRVLGIAWLGIRTADDAATARFFERVLGLHVQHREPGFTVLDAPGGDRVEVFGADDGGKQHFTTGPVAGFLVDNVGAARDELLAAGVELLGEPGPTWQHFRGPDGNVYEVVETPGA